MPHTIGIRIIYFPFTKEEKNEGIYFEVSSGVRSVLPKSRIVRVVIKDVSQDDLTFERLSTVESVGK